ALSADRRSVTPTPYAAPKRARPRTWRTGVMSVAMMTAHAATTGTSAQGDRERRPRTTIALSPATRPAALEAGAPSASPPAWPAQTTVAPRTGQRPIVTMPIANTAGTRTRSSVEEWREIAAHAALAR